MNPLRIVIADDHELVRGGIRALVGTRPGWEIIAEAADGRDAVQIVHDMKPDVVVMDIGMPNLNGLDATRQIVAAVPQTRILILTMHHSEQIIREVIAAGAQGFLLKSDTGKELINAIEALQNHRTFFATETAGYILDGYLSTHRTAEAVSKSVLTQREGKSCNFSREGKRTKEVAAMLNLSVKTAETHRTNIMRKLDIHSIADLTLYAVRNGLVRLF